MSITFSHNLLVQFLHCWDHTAWNASYMLDIQLNASCTLYRYPISLGFYAHFLASKIED